MQPLQLFLFRNLSYINCKKSRVKKFKRRSNSSSKSQSIDALCENLTEKKRGPKHYVTFTFAGFHGNESMGDARFAEAQLIVKDTKAIVGTSMR